MATDPQTKGATGAGLLSGGAALLVASGVGALFGAVAGGFQFGYGLGMVTKASAERRRLDEKFAAPVELVTLDIKPLTNPTKEPAAIANHGNAALKELGHFVASMRATAVALNRYHTATLKESNDSDASQMQLGSVHSFFQMSREALESVSHQFCQFSKSIESHPAGKLAFNVRKVYGDFQRNLCDSGLPESEQPYIKQFRLSSEEQSELIDTFIQTTPEQAVALYGEHVTFSVLVGLLAENAQEIASKLSRIINLPPMHCNSIIPE